MNKPKVLILGYGRHGKDEVAAMLNRWYGLKSESSSHFAIHNGVFDAVKDATGEPTPEALYENRAKYREILYHAIRDYNSPDKATLTRRILEKADVYVGMRDMEEFEASRYYFDLILWVDSTERTGHIEKDSMNIPMEVADIVIRNNGTLEELRQKLSRVFNTIFGYHQHEGFEGKVITYASKALNHSEGFIEEMANRQKPSQSTFRLMEVETVYADADVEQVAPHKVVTLHSKASGEKTIFKFLAFDLTKMKFILGGLGYPITRPIECGLDLISEIFSGYQPQDIDHFDIQPTDDPTIFILTAKDSNPICSGSVRLKVQPQTDHG